MHVLESQGHGRTIRCLGNQADLQLACLQRQYSHRGAHIWACQLPRRNLAHSLGCAGVSWVCLRCGGRCDGRDSSYGSSSTAQVP